MIRALVFARKLRTMFSVEYAYMLEYRAEIILWAFSGVLPFIMMGVWIKAGKSSDLPLDGMQLAHYFVAVFVVRQLTIVWVTYSFQREVVEGKLSPLLLLPIHPVCRSYCAHLAEQATRAPFAAVILLGFFCVYPEAFWMPSLPRLAAFFFVILGAFTLRFALHYAFALLNLWSERAMAAQDLMFIPYLFLSGLVAPLEMFPPAMREIAYATPFPYMLHVPVQILLGGPVDWPRTLLTTGGWAVTFGLLCTLMWRRGIKHYSAMGA